MAVLAYGSPETSESDFNLSNAVVTLAAEVAGLAACQN